MNGEFNWSASRCQLSVVSCQLSAVSGLLAPCQLFVVLITFVRNDKGYAILVK